MPKSSKKIPRSESSGGFVLSVSVHRAKADIQADYVGFTVPDEFVVGYGLDYDERYRNLPYIGVLKPEVYSI